MSLSESKVLLRKNEAEGTYNFTNLARIQSLTHGAAATAATAATLYHTDTRFGRRGFGGGKHGRSDRSRGWVKRPPDVLLALRAATLHTPTDL